MLRAVESNSAHDNPTTTMNNQHTPGPWTIQDLGLSRGEQYPGWHTYCVRAPNYVHLATVGDVDRFYQDSNKANARLIAAAPELLAALHNAADLLTKISGQADNVEIYSKSEKGSNIVAGTIRELSRDALAPIRAAIAKAERQS